MKVSKKWKKIHEQFTEELANNDYNFVVYLKQNDFTPETLKSRIEVEELRKAFQNEEEVIKLVKEYRDIRNTEQSVEKTKTIESYRNKFEAYANEEKGIGISEEEFAAKKDEDKKKAEQLFGEASKQGHQGAKQHCLDNKLVGLLVLLKEQTTLEDKAKILNDLEGLANSGHINSSHFLGRSYTQGDERFGIVNDEVNKVKGIDYLASLFSNPETSNDVRDECLKLIKDTLTNKEEINGKGFFQVLKTENIEKTISELLENNKTKEEVLKEIKDRIDAAINTFLDNKISAVAKISGKKKKINKAEEVKAMIEKVANLPDTSVDTSSLKQKVESIIENQKETKKKKTKEQIDELISQEAQNITKN
ncbi:12393_t:CDS:2 [Racocetra persica]|uniref:12393_t:CDS:1 n=1 Tax=Racocetra persica TaxID=160502 RepID=A0ACA9NLH7_9GLOM|nr:12393_t:CDS:2 [Racocetra persica]